jgi:hypothetical protein
MIVATAPGRIATVSTSASSIALVEALPPGDLFEVIGDDGLLALMGGRPAALVYHDSAAELVFLNPADANGFKIQ